MRDIGRFVATPAMRRRREVGSVGLDQDAVRREFAGDCLEIRCLPEGQDSGERYIESKFDCNIR